MSTNGLTVVIKSAILCGSGFLDPPLLLMQKGLTIVTKSAILCGSGFLDPPLLLMQKGFLIVSGGTAAVKEHWEEICLITNIASEFLNYFLPMLFIMLNLLSSVLIFISKNVLI